MPWCYVFFFFFFFGEGKEMDYKKHLGFWFCSGAGKE